MNNLHDIIRSMVAGSHIPADLAITFIETTRVDHAAPNDKEKPSESSQVD